MLRPNRAAVHFSGAALSNCQLQMHSQMLSITCQPSTLKLAGCGPKQAA